MREKKSAESFSEERSIKLTDSLVEMENKPRRSQIFPDSGMKI